MTTRNEYFAAIRTNPKWVPTWYNAIGANVREHINPRTGKVAASLSYHTRKGVTICLYHVATEYTYQCSECGSDDIKAWTKWDQARQLWIAAEHDAHVFCNDCQNECDPTEVEA